MKLSNYVVCTAKIVAKTDKIEEVMQIFAKLKKHSTQEAGCMRYELHKDRDHNNIFLFVDRFKDMEAFELHCQQAYTIKYFDEMLPKLTDSIEFHLYHEIID